MQAAVSDSIMHTGAQTELEALFREHHDLVFRAAYRLTGNTLDAEDVLQTVFLRLMKQGDDVDLSPSPIAYLHRAAVNASLDLLRSPARLKSTPLDDVVSESITSPGLSPEMQLSTSEMKDMMRRAVAGLGSRAAEVTALRYFEGLDNKEIAENLGMSQMVVAVTLHRARTRLRKEVGKFLEENTK